jgi:hypothetical protein
MHGLCTSRQFVRCPLHAPALVLTSVDLNEISGHVEIVALIELAAAEEVAFAIDLPSSASLSMEYIWLVAAAFDGQRLH